MRVFFSCECVHVRVDVSTLLYFIDLRKVTLHNCSWDSYYYEPKPDYRRNINLFPYTRVVSFDLSVHLQNE